MILRRLKKKFFIVISLFFLGCSSSIELPKEEEMIGIFKKGKADFEWVVNDFMLNGFYRVAIQSNGGVSVKPINVSKMLDIDNYKKKLINIKVDLVQARLNYPISGKPVIESVYFFIDREGFVFGGEHIGVAYEPGHLPEQSLLTISLDKYIAGARQNGTFMNKIRIYQKITGYWYLFFEYFD